MKKNLLFLFAVIIFFSVLPGSCKTLGEPDMSQGANLALGKTAQASSRSGGADSAFDGKAFTNWTSAGANPQWIRVDLGGHYTVCRVVLNWAGSNYGTDYFIEVSDDDMNWNVVADRFLLDLPRNGNNRVDDIYFKDVEARYVRMYGTGRQGNFSLRGFEVYGPHNIAAGKTAAAGSEWFGIDLDDILQVGSVKINWGEHYASEYTIKVSDNGTDWHDAYHTANGTGGIETINLAPLNASRYTQQDGIDPENTPARRRPDGSLDVNREHLYARFVRVHPAGRRDDYSINELEIYGNPFRSVPNADNNALMPNINLNEGWMLARAPDISASPAGISAPGFDVSGDAWFNAIVPGTVLTSFFKAGLIEDPYFSDNIRKLDQWYYNVDYWYRKEFTLPPEYTGQNMVLNVEGVNWHSDIYVNGQKLGSTVGPFKREQFDVTRYLVPGTANVIAVNIHIFPTRADELDGNANNDGRYDQIMMLPHIMSSGGWDWIPPIPGRNVGIIKDITLTTRNRVAIKNPIIQTDLPWVPPVPNGPEPTGIPSPADTAYADISFSAELVNNGDTAISGIIKGLITPGGINVQKEVTIPANRTITVSFNRNDFAALRVDNPRLWWPNGYGEQFLHDIEFGFEIDGVVSDTFSYQFGIREYGYWWKDGTAPFEWIMGDGRRRSAYNNDTNSKSLQFFCNGVRIMAKGGNWGMTDAMLGWTAREYDIALRMHADMNFTMIRDWIGTADFDDFYKAADKFGIMIWADFWVHGFWQTNIMGPFLQNARAKVQRIRNHTSLVIYCGGNEWTPWGILDNEPNGPGWAPGNRPTGILPQIVAELDPGRLYITQSNAQPVRGGVSYMIQDPVWYYTTASRHQGFTTEIGTSVMPVYESVMEMMEEQYWWPPRDNSRPFGRNINYMWQIHDLGGPDDIGNKGAEGYLDQIDRRYGRSENLVDFSMKAQLINYETNRAMFEAWNNYMWNNTSGILLWMSQSAWPSFIWQTYDSFFDMNGAYFGSRKASRPVNVQFDYQDRIIKVINNTPAPLQNITVTADLYNLDGTLSTSRTATLTAAASSATQALDISADLTGESISSTHFINLTLRDAGNNVLSENFYWDSNRSSRTSYALSILPQITLNAFIIDSAVTGGVTTMTVELRNESSDVAVMTRLKVMQGSGARRVLPVFYSDNYFAMLPGTSKQVIIEFETRDLDGHEPVLRMEGFNTAHAIITRRGR
ncbi:MAG: discoidin domain-containing protein [Treponema sp.]|nr:discoidin domain-containing protein [Treponema sp.]